MSKQQTAVEDSENREAVIPEDVETTKAILQEAVESQIETLSTMFPPRIADKVIFTDNYPQGYGKKLTAFIMEVYPDWKADLATLDKSQNPICHPRPGIPYDVDGKPGTWRYPEQ